MVQHTPWRRELWRRACCVAAKEGQEAAAAPRAERHVQDSSPATGHEAQADFLKGSCRRFGHRSCASQRAVGVLLTLERLLCEYGGLGLVRCGMRCESPVPQHKLMRRLNSDLSMLC